MRTGGGAWPDEAWTRQRVEARLVETFRAMPATPVYSTGAKLRTVAEDRAPLTDVLEWGSFLDHDPAGRLYLYAWARCQATRSSFAALCREMGWPRTTAEAGRRRGAAAIAAVLNAAAPARAKTSA